MQENKKTLDLHNITAWHAAGYTGKGMRIAVLDQRGELYNYQQGAIHTPLGGIVYGSEAKSGHMGQCCAVLQEVCPDAEIYALQKSPDAERWALENKPDIVSMSLTASLGLRAEFEKSGIPVFVAAGNDGKERLTGAAAYPFTITVGAYSTGRGNVVYYSNSGEELDCVACTNVYIKNNEGGIFPMNGTSCATPVAAGMMALYMQKCGRMSWEAVLAVLPSMCRDIPGDRDGLGLFVLPDATAKEVDEMEIKMTLGQKTAFVNGWPVELLRAPEEKSGTTLVPVRFLSEALGFTVKYEPKTREITILK